MKDKDKIEIRSAEPASYDVEAGTVEGYAAVFDEVSVQIMGFREIIRRGAITEAVISSSDVFALIDHDHSRGILARRRNGKGSLELSLDERGLKYRFTLPNSPVGQELRSYLERGEITASSFAFTVTKDEWAKNGDGTYTRSVLEIDRLYDVSPVFIAAYENTEVAMRSIERMKQDEIAAEAAAALVKNTREKAVRNARLARLKLNMR
jgi:HK97 family phage prohead protease